MNKRKFGVGRGFSVRGKGPASRSPPEKRSRRDNIGNSSQGPTDRVVRVRDRRGQELAGDGAEKEFPRAWGLLHETMKTKFGIDKLDFSTTTLQLAGHDDVIHRCMVKIYKPRNFQATGEGYSSRVAESRCAAMACITLRDLGVLPGGNPNNTASHWQQEKQDQFDPLEPLCISISPEWQNKLFEAITALPECGHFISYQRLAQYFGQPVKRKSLLQAPTAPATGQGLNGASQHTPGQFGAQQKHSFRQPQSFGDDPQVGISSSGPKPLFPELSSSSSKDDRSHESVSSQEPVKDTRPKKFELCLKSQTSGEESSFSLLLPPNVVECFPSSQMIQCPSCSVWVSISLRKTQVESHSFVDHSESKGLVINTNMSGVGYDRHEDQHGYRQEQFHNESHESAFGTPPIGARSFQSGVSSAQDMSHPGKSDGEIYDIFTGQLYVAITPSEAQDRCREMARGLSIIRASTNVYRDNAARLPIASMRSRVVNLTNEHQVVIVHGPPGCGKTTQVPQFLLEDYTDSGRGSYCNIVIAYPHRVVAMASAERISAERNEKLGDTVGYEVDVGYCIPTNSGRVMFCTNEVLLAKIRLNPMLMGVSHVIIDEANERRLHTDFLLAILKLILPNRRDLKLIVLTTTDHADNLANYFFNMRFQQPAMCVEVPVETPAVNMYYLNDIEQILHWRTNMESSLDEGLSPVTDVNLALITRLILHIADTQLPGNILVLLPGLDDILAVRVSLQNALRLGKDQLIIVLLHSKLAVTELQKVHQRGMVQLRKVILADHLAESSVTVDNVSYVICSGKIKEVRYDPVKKISACISSWCTRLTIDHQCHNAAFSRPCGTCYCLFTKRNHQEMIDRPVAEVHQTSLERVALLSKILYPNMKIAEMMSKIIEPAPVMSVTMAVNNLVTMGALDESESLTPLGTAMASLSADPKISKMLLLAASLGVIEPVLTVAAWFDCSDPFVLDDIPIQQQIEGRMKYVATTNSDQLALVNAYNGWMHSQFTKAYADSHCLHMASLLMIKGLKEHFTSEMLGLDIGNPELFNRHASSEHMVKATLCAGLYPNILRCFRNERGDQWGRVLMETKLDGSVDKHPLSVATVDIQQQHSWFVFHQKEKRWLPYHVQQAAGPDELIDHLPKSRPWSSSSAQRFNTRPTSRVSSSKLRRPQSTPLVLPQEISSDERDEKCSASEHYNYDSLTPAILYELANGQVPESIYGERPVSAPNGEIVKQNEVDEDEENEPTGDPSDQETTGDPKDQENVVRNVTKIENDGIGTAERESDDDSDDENIPEPEVDQVEMAKIPNLKLRPEKADALYVPWAKGDQRKYDFDAEHLEQPTYEFKDPLSSQMLNLNLKDLSRTDKNWRDIVSVKPIDALESKLISRMIEFERLQRKTIDMERERKLRGTRGARNKAATLQTNSKTRLDMNCCPDCIQVACVGNCPGKKLPSGVCIFCSEKDCKENCQNSVYESRTRAEKCNNVAEDPDVKIKPPLPRPRTCTSCQQKYNTIKPASFTNNRVMSRPRSSNSVLRNNSFRPKELKSRSCLPNNDFDLDEEFAKLGIVATADQEEGGLRERNRPHTAGCIRRLRGRAAILPGKSFFSQRKESLTDITKEEKIRLAVIATKKRLRSAKKKRPKTAM